MCLLIVAPAGHTPDRDAIQESAVMNDDGFGFAIATPDRGMLRGRGMDLDTVCDWYFQLRSLYPQSHSMFHLRMTTHGRTDQSNCHPFLVAGRDDIVLGHNGILPIDVPNGDHRSDTRIFAEEFMAHWGVDCLDDAVFMEELGVWAKGSKLAVLHTTTDLNSEFYIVNEGDGHWADGCWWSNYSYERYTSRYTYKSTGVGKWQATPKDSADDDAEYQEWLALNAKSLDSHQVACDEYWAEVDATGVPEELSDPYWHSADGSRQATFDKVNGRYIEGSLNIDGTDLVEMRCWHCDTACSIDVGPNSDHNDDFCRTCSSCIFCGDYYVACKCDHQSHRTLYAPAVLEDVEECLAPDDDEGGSLIKRAAIALSDAGLLGGRRGTRGLWAAD